jgi:hypothetical protein
MRVVHVMCVCMYDDTMMLCLTLTNRPVTCASLHARHGLLACLQVDMAATPLSSRLMHVVDGVVAAAAAGKRA